MEKCIKICEKRLISFSQRESHVTGRYEAPRDDHGETIPAADQYRRRRERGGRQAGLSAAAGQGEFVTFVLLFLLF